MVLQNANGVSGRRANEVAVDAVPRLEADLAIGRVEFREALHVHRHYLANNELAQVAEHRRDVARSNRRHGLVDDVLVAEDAVRVIGGKPGTHKGRPNLSSRRLSEASVESLNIYFAFRRYVGSMLRSTLMRSFVPMLVAPVAPLPSFAFEPVALMTGA
jgi:hypothetical protein